MLTSIIKKSGEKIKEFRISSGLTVKKIVDYINNYGNLEGTFSEREWYNLEKGAFKSIRYDILPALVDLGADLDYIFS